MSCHSTAGKYQRESPVSATTTRSRARKPSEIDQQTINITAMTIMRTANSGVNVDLTIAINSALCYRGLGVLCSGSHRRSRHIHRWPDSRRSLPRLSLSWRARHNRSCIRLSSPIICFVSPPGLALQVEITSPPMAMMIFLVALGSFMLVALVLGSRTCLLQHYGLPTV